MHYTTYRFWAIVSVVLVSPYLAEGKPKCDAPEVFDVYPTGKPAERYNSLVCEGVRYMDAGQYVDAAKTMEEALRMEFLDVPNYALLPRLALAYYRAGRLEEAKSHLRMAELSLSLVAGVIECTVTVPFKLRTKAKFHSGPRELKIGPEEKETISRMCGEGLTWSYGGFAIDELRLVVDELVYYWRVKDEIEGRVIHHP